MPLTSFGRQHMLDSLLGNGAYTPAALKLSLHTASPGDAGSHANEVSTSGTGYARISLVGVMGATDSTSGISTNDSSILFGPATLNWGAVNYVALEDESAGKMVWYGVASPPRTINDGASFQVAAGQLQLRLN